MAEAKAGTRLAELAARWRQEPKSTAFFPYAEELRRAGELERAIEVLEQGLAMHPTYLAARVAMGRNLLEVGETVAAVEVLERALAQDPTQLVASKLLIEAHLRLGNRESASEHLAKYRLLVGRDPELEQLEARLGATRASEPQVLQMAATEASGARAEDVVFDLSAIPTSVSPLRFDPVSARRLERAAPFGTWLPPADWATRWFAFSRTEGIFPVLQPSPPRVEVPLEPVTTAEAQEPFAFPVPAPSRAAGRVVVASAESSRTVLEPPPWIEAETPVAPTEPRPVFGPQEIGLDVERELAGQEPETLGQSVLETLSEVETEVEAVTGPSLPRPEPSPVGVEVQEEEESALPPERPSWVLARLLLEQGHLDEAEQEYRKVLRERPGQPEAVAGLEAVAARRQALVAFEVEPAKPAATVGSRRERSIAALKTYLARIQRARELLDVS